MRRRDVKEKKKRKEGREGGEKRREERRKGRQEGEREKRARNREETIREISECGKRGRINCINHTAVQYISATAASHLLGRFPLHK